MITDFIQHGLGINISIPNTILTKYIFLSLWLGISSSCITLCRRIILTSSLKYIALACAHVQTCFLFKYTRCSLLHYIESIFSWPCPSSLLTNLSLKALLFPQFVLSFVCHSHTLSSRGIHTFSSCECWQTPHNHSGKFDMALPYAFHTTPSPCQSTTFNDLGKPHIILLI